MTEHHVGPKPARVLAGKGGGADQRDPGSFAVMERAGGAGPALPAGVLLVQVVERRLEGAARAGIGGPQANRPPQPVGQLVVGPEHPAVQVHLGRSVVGQTSLRQQQRRLPSPGENVAGGDVLDAPAAVTDQPQLGHLGCLQAFTAQRLDRIAPQLSDLHAFSLVDVWPTLRRTPP
jgi:hypothetical protein